MSYMPRASTVINIEHVHISPLPFPNVDSLSDNYTKIINSIEMYIIGEKPE